MLSNRTLKYLNSLKQKKQRERQKKFLIEGVRLCEEAIAAAQPIERVLHIPGELLGERGREIVNRCRRSGIECNEVDERTLGRLADTVSPQGIVAVVHKRETTLPDLMAARPHNIVALDKIKDPGNLGTICRTAAWFGIDGLLLSLDCVELYNPKVIRASMGAAFYLSLCEHIDLGQAFSSALFDDFRVTLATVDGASDYKTLDTGDKNLVILGGETDRIEDSITRRVDSFVCIPGYGHGDSLNVSVAAGILLAELKRTQIERA